MLVNDEYEQFVPPTIKTVELPDWAAETRITLLTLCQLCYRKVLA
jgi:hypothetical protein